MEKLHIALVGAQTMPIYIGIRESDADKFILIHSAETKSIAEIIARYIDRDNTILFELPAWDFPKMKDRIDGLLAEYKDWRIEANISGGSKPWGFMFSMLAFEYSNLSLFFVDQSCMIHNISDLTSRMAKPLDGGIRQILEFNQILESNQASSVKHVDLKSYDEKDISILPEIKRCRKKYQKIFNDLTIPKKDNKNRYQNNKLDTIVDNQSQSEISWDIRGPEQKVKLTFINRLGNSETVAFQSPHAFDMVVSSGWFEYEVAKCLDSWPEAKDIWLNSVFPYRNNTPKNEIDIIVNVGYKLLFVECKTKIFDKTDIDKFRSAVKNYGGLSSKAMFISLESMDAQTIEKCETNGIEYFSLDGKPAVEKKKTLFAKLNTIMGVSNTK